MRPIGSINKVFVSRPALAASRSIEIIEFLALFPDREFTLSEISRATNINVASCYAVLARLTERGYLSRAFAEKTYKLGPSLISVGQAAFKSQPIVARARAIADELLSDLGVPVLLSTVVGDEILAVFALEDAAGRHPGMWVGERLPLVAPVGAPFLAWASEEEVKAWVNRRTSAPARELGAEWRRDLDLTRSRGYQVTMRGQDERSIASLMSEVATRRGGVDYKNKVAGLINTYEHHKSQPPNIEADQLYEVHLIASPIFDANGAVAFSLGLGGFSQKLSGAMIKDYADRLMRACLEVMRTDRSQLRHRARPPAGYAMTSTPKARAKRMRKR